MKKILIVDDNVETRNTLITQLRAIYEFSVLSTDRAKAAAELIQTQPIDLLITELNLPEIDGFKLLSHVKNHSRDTQAIAISNAFSSQLIKKLKALGDYYYLNKPVKIDSLIDIISEKLDVQPQTVIHGISLVSFLQLINFEQKTCTLTLHTNEKQGVIHCVNGETIGAQTDDLNGRDAFHKIMEWGCPTIKIKASCQNTERQINVPLMQLLMESHQLIDESGSVGSKTSTQGVPGDTSKTESRMDGNFEFHHEDLEFKELKTLLSRTPGVLNYEIFFNNTVLNKSDSLNNSFDVQPLEYFSIGNSISNIVGGSLKYSKINQADRSSYLIGKSNQYFIKAKLKPGTKIGDIIR